MPACFFPQSSASGGDPKAAGGVRDQDWGPGDAGGGGGEEAKGGNGGFNCDMQSLVNV